MVKYIRPNHNVTVELILILFVSALFSNNVIAYVPMQRSIRVVINNIPGHLSLGTSNKPAPPRIVNSNPTEISALVNIIDGHNLTVATLRMDRAQRTEHKAEKLPLLPQWKRYLAYDILDFKTSIMIYEVPRNDNDYIRNYLSLLKKNKWHVFHETSQNTTHALYRAYKNDESLVINASMQAKSTYITLWLTYTH